VSAPSPAPRVDRILELKPDLAIGFSDIQADIAAALIKAGVEVWIANHRTRDGYPGLCRRLGALVGCVDEAQAYARAACVRMWRPCVHEAAVAAPAACLLRGMGRAADQRDPWVSELVTIAGGDDIFPERAACALARDRILADPLRSGARAPDLIIGSWCGKKFRPSTWRRGPGGRRARRARRRAARGQEPADPAARAGGVDRRAGCAARIVRHWAARPTQEN
jgi:iron complex transport system substrate-binding protein